MSLPIFFAATLAPLYQSLTLDEDTSRHVSQVLRMRKGELLQLTDGKGSLVTAEIMEAHKKHSEVRITQSSVMSFATRTTTVAISLLKNTSRFEWFLEKATEIGVRQIVPLICERTERQHFRFDRMQAVLISAMLQSQQTWLPQLHEPLQLSAFLQQSVKWENTQKFVAHCVDKDNKQHLNSLINSALNNVILIGPEGDFTNDEISLALQHQFLPVSLGDTRLRAETAGIVAATLLVMA